MTKYDVSEKQAQYLLENLAPLYHKYPYQSQAQDAFVEFDVRTGEVYVEYNAEVGNAVPSPVWYGHVQRFEVDSCVNGEWLLNTIRDEKTQSLFEKVMLGYEQVGDKKALFDHSAVDALDELHRIFRDTFPEDLDEVWDAGYYFIDPLEEITASTTDDEIDLLVEKYQDEAREEGILLIHLEETFVGMRKNAQEKEEDSILEGEA